MPRHPGAEANYPKHFFGDCKLTVPAVQYSNERKWRKVTNKVFSSAPQHPHHVHLFEPSNTSVYCRRANGSSSAMQPLAAQLVALVC